MDSLKDTEWDVLIVGTGIHQSLLALALSRSDLKILHIDRNDYYGGAEAALNLLDAEKWAERASLGPPGHPFRHVSIKNHSDDAKIANQRAYNLALAPNLIYTTSALIPALVESRVHSQLEFKAVGSWYVYQRSGSEGDVSPLSRIPESREDIFADSTLDMRTKGALVRALRYIHGSDTAENSTDRAAEQDQTFSQLLTTRFKLPRHLQSRLQALALSAAPEDDTSQEFAIERIATHLRSFNKLGPGFNAVTATYGGLCEVSQVSCRAAAVGGATYILNCTVEEVTWVPDRDGLSDGSRVAAVRLSTGDTVTARHVCGSLDQTPFVDDASMETKSGVPGVPSTPPRVMSRSITVVDSPLQKLFQRRVEGAPTPAAVVVVFPSAAEIAPEFASRLHPVHIIVHSSDTGECPKGQCVIYASIAVTKDQGSRILEKAITALLAEAGEEALPDVLWSMSYEQYSDYGRGTLLQDPHHQNLHVFGTSSLDTVFDDSVIETVKQAWHAVKGNDDSTFLEFLERDGRGEVDDPT